MYKGARLTSLQLETLQYAANDQSAEMIGLHQKASTTTVHGRLYIVRQKLGTKTTAGAVAEGFRRGILR